MKYLTKEWKRENDLYEACLHKMFRRGIFSYAKWGKALEDVAETALAETEAASGETGLAEELDDVLYNDVLSIGLTGSEFVIEFTNGKVTVTDCGVSEWERFELGDDKPILYAAELYKLDSGKYELHLLIGDKDDKKPIEYYCVTVAGYMSIKPKA